MKHSTTGIQDLNIENMPSIRVTHMTLTQVTTMSTTALTTVRLYRETIGINYINVPPSMPIDRNRRCEEGKRPKESGDHAVREQQTARHFIPESEPLSESSNSVNIRFA